jgi:hypothetical protein
LLGPRWTPSRVVLVDQAPIVRQETLDAFRALMWHVEPVEMDVFQWLQRPGASRSDVMLTNLFLHHFGESELRRLFADAAARADCFMACEPRRSRSALAATQLLWFIGTNSVTRHDGRLSVRAGFADRDLSDLWASDTGWVLQEHASGWVSHWFSAIRKPSPTSGAASRR